MGLVLALSVPQTGGPAWAGANGLPAEGTSLSTAAAGISVDEMPPVMREAYIRGIQEELGKHGYEPGPIDGILGPRTAHAIRAYQRDAGLVVDGAATKELLEHLKFALPKVYRAAPAAPSDRDLVLAVQAELGRRGYYMGPLDGIPGRETLAAVRSFQADAGLPVTGKLDRGLLDDLRPGTR